MANIYSYLGRVNLALCVTLTAVSCLAAVLTTPLTLAVLQAQVSEAFAFRVPLALLARQLFLMLVLPVLFGMGIRQRWPDITKQHGRKLLAFTIAALAMLLGVVIVQEAEHFASAFTEIGVASALLTVLAFTAGWATAWVSGATAMDRFTVGIAFVVRNVGLATAVAVTVLGRVEFAVFATAYFLAQAPLLVMAALVFRRMRAVEIREMKTL